MLSSIPATHQFVSVSTHILITIMISYRYRHLCHIFDTLFDTVTRIWHTINTNLTHFWHYDTHLTEIWQNFETMTLIWHTFDTVIPIWSYFIFLSFYVSSHVIHIWHCFWLSDNNSILFLILWHQFDLTSFFYHFMCHHMWHIFDTLFDSLTRSSFGSFVVTLTLFC